MPSFPTKTIEALNEIVTSLLFFLTPLFFVFFTKELFEFPKMILVYIFAATLGFLYLAGGRWPPRLLKPPDWLPFLFLLLASSLATIFSSHGYTSLFGYYSRFNGGLVSLLSLSVIYFCLWQNLSAQKAANYLRTIFASGIFVSLYALLQNFGFDKDFWVQDSQARAFSTLGQPNWLAAYLLVILPIPIYYYLEESLTLKKIFYLAICVLYYFAFWATYSLSGFFGLTGLAIVVILTSGRALWAKRTEVLLLIALCLTISVLRPGIFGAKFSSLVETLQPKITFNRPAWAAPPNNTKKEIDTGDIRLSVWLGALDLWRRDLKSLLIGAGPETFAYNFLSFRPLSLNQTSEWDFLYNKAHNYYLDLLTGTGLLGLIAYLGFVYAVGKKQLKVAAAGPPEKINQSRLLFAGWTTILTTNLFGWPTVYLSLLTFTLPLIMAKLSQNGSEAAPPAETHLPYLRLGLILPIFILILVQILNIFLADVSFSQGLSEADQDREEAEANFKDAISLNPYEPAYPKELAFVLAQKAVTEAEAQKRKSLARQAEKVAQRAYQLNPKNSLTLRSLIKTYYLLSRIDEAYEKDLEDLVKVIIRLSPTEPRSYLDAGLAFFSLGKVKEASASIERSLELKPDYVEAREFLERLKEADQDIETTLTD